MAISRDLLEEAEAPYIGLNIQETERLVEQRRRMLKWAAARQLRLAGSNHCLHWLLPVGERGHSCPYDCELSVYARSYHLWMDHVSFWTHARRPAIMVAQPYHISRADILHIAEIIKRNPELDIQIGESWYGYGTTLIEISRRIKTANEKAEETEA